MSNVNAHNLSLNVFINKEKTKVLFAEANGDFLNVLLSFLTIPLGKIVTILKKHKGSEAIGSLTTLYKSLFELDSALFSTRGAKEMLLNPQSSFQSECRKLALDVADTAPLQYFLCEDAQCPITADSTYAYDNISMYSDIAKSACGRSFNRELSLVESRDQDGAFVITPFYFIISDDLRVAPILTGNLEALADFGITDTRGAEMKSLSLGFHEIRELLKLSLTSATPLTDMVMKNTVENPQSGICLDHILQAATESRKIVLKTFFHKSTNQFSFAEGTDELVELLLSFLTVPLGGVLFLLGSNTPFKCIENLYRSVSDGGIDDKYFTTSETKNRLINLKLAHGYLSKNQLLPLNEEGPPKLYYKHVWKQEYNHKEMRWVDTGYECSFHAKQRNGGASQVSSFKSNKGVFLKKQVKCYVSDDFLKDGNREKRG